MSSLASVPEKCQKRCSSCKDGKTYRKEKGRVHDTSVNGNEYRSGIHAVPSKTDNKHLKTFIALSHPIRFSRRDRWKLYMM